MFESQQPPSCSTLPFGLWARLALSCAVLILCLGITGCGDCTTEARWGLKVLVHDYSTGAAAGAGATVMAVTPGHSETLQPFPDAETFVGATERPGRYTLTVSKPGYQLWTRESVQVEAGACHVETETVLAEIHRLPATSP